MAVSGRRIGGILAVAIAVGSGLTLAIFILYYDYHRVTPDTRGEVATPEYYLWAWRRLEDISFIEPLSANAAIWTGTIFIEDGDLLIERRTVAVTYPSDIGVVAVTRLEVTGVYGIEVARSAAAAIVATSAPFHPVEYQVDFDALHSQRQFYRLLLQELRNLIGESVLSITAFASWCMLDNWIGTLPIDSAVPMLYRLGPGGESVIEKLRSTRSFPEPICAGNVGYSADEPAIWLDDLERVFLFHPKPWSRHRFETFVAQLEESR